MFYSLGESPKMALLSDYSHHHTVYYIPEPTATEIVYPLTTFTHSLHPKTSNPTPPQPPISSLFKIYLLYLFALNVSVAPYTRYISCKQHTYRWVFFFLIDLNNLYLLVYLIQLHLLWLLIYLGLNLPLTIVDFFCPICSTFLFSHLFALFCIKYYFVILFFPLLAS